MTRDELVKLHEEIFALVTELDKLGDYDANAPRIRRIAKAVLKLTDHTLGRMRRPA